MRYKWVKINETKYSQLDENSRTISRVHGYLFMLIRKIQLTLFSNIIIQIYNICRSINIFLIFLYNYQINLQPQQIFIYLLYMEQAIHPHKLKIILLSVFFLVALLVAGTTTVILYINQQLISYINGVNKNFIQSNASTNSYNSSKSHYHISYLNIMGIFAVMAISVGSSLIPFFIILIQKAYQSEKRCCAIAEKKLENILYLGISFTMLLLGLTFGYLLSFFMDLSNSSTYQQSFMIPVILSAIAFGCTLISWIIFLFYLNTRIPQDSTFPVQQNLQLIQTIQEKNVNNEQKMIEMTHVSQHDDREYKTVIKANNVGEMEILEFELRKNTQAKDQNENTSVKYNGGEELPVFENQQHFYSEKQSEQAEELRNQLLNKEDEVPELSLSKYVSNGGDNNHQLNRNETQQMQNKIFKGVMILKEFQAHPTMNQQQRKQQQIIITTNENQIDQSHNNKRNHQEKQAENPYRKENKVEFVVENMNVQPSSIKKRKLERVIKETVIQNFNELEVKAIPVKRKRFERGNLNNINNSVKRQEEQVIDFGNFNQIQQDQRMISKQFTPNTSNKKPLRPSRNLPIKRNKFLSD